MIERRPRHWKRRTQYLVGTLSGIVLLGAGTIFAVGIAGSDATASGASQVCVTATSPARTISGPTHTVRVDDADVYTTAADSFVVPEAVATQCTDVPTQTETTTVTETVGSTTTTDPVTTETLPTTTTPTTTSTPTTTTVPTTTTTGGNGKTAVSNNVWACAGAVDYDSVTINQAAAGNETLAFDANDCHGVIRNLVIHTARCDGLKGTLHDLEVMGGEIIVNSDPTRACHHDAIQLYSSHNVHFHNMTIRGFGHSGFFISATGSNPRSNDVTCDHCDIRGLSASLLWDNDADIAAADNSGVSNSIMGAVSQPKLACHNGIYIPSMPHGLPTATGVINFGNTYLKNPSDPVC